MWKNFKKSYRYYYYQSLAPTARRCYQVQSVHPDFLSHFQFAIALFSPQLHNLLLILALLATCRLAIACLRSLATNNNIIINHHTLHSTNYNTCTLNAPVYSPYKYSSSDNWLFTRESISITVLSILHLQPTQHHQQFSSARWIIVQVKHSTS